MDFASKNLTGGQLNAIVKKLGGEQGALRFLRGELVVSTAKPLEMPVWKTVKLGLHKSSEHYRVAMENAKQKLGDWDDEILGRITYSQEEVDLDLVLLSVGDLGFKVRAKYSDICAKAVELGLEFCPAEVGPALRLQYPEQPRGEGVMIAMEAVANGVGAQSIFHVEHDRAGLWLDGYLGHSNQMWWTHCRFVFIRRK